jgi:hypothetical protein
VFPHLSHISPAKITNSERNAKLSSKRTGDLRDIDSLDHIQFVTCISFSPPKCGICNEMLFFCSLNFRPEAEWIVW